MNDVIVVDRLPWLVRVLGGKFREYPLKREYRMRWGELSCTRWGLALALNLFSEHYSLHVHLGLVNLYVRLPFLQRWHREPEEMLESWGFSTLDGAVHLHWGSHSKILHLPWANWRHLSHDVRRADGSWVPFVGSWEHEKVPDGRQEAAYPYRYVCRNGDVQNVTATIYVERRRWRLKHLPIFRSSHSISVAFNEEVGEGRGSWKGGTVGCSYELRPDETPLECLKRMSCDRKFER